MQDELDPAVKIVRQLMEAYPLVNSRLFTGKLKKQINSWSTPKNLPSNLFLGRIII